MNPIKNILFFGSITLLFYLFIGSSCNGQKKEDVPDLNFFDSSIISGDEAQKEFRLFREVVLKIHPGIGSFSQYDSITSFYNNLEKTLKAKKTISDLEFYKVLCKAIDHLNCAHSYVEFPDNMRNRLRNNGERVYIPLDIYFNKGRYFINKWENSPLNHGELVEIDGISIKEYFNRLRTYSSVDFSNSIIDSFALTSDFYFKYFLEYDLPFYTAGAKNSSTISDDKISILYRKNNALQYDTLYRVSFSDRLAFMPPTTNPADTIKNTNPYDLEIWDSLHTALLTLRTFEFNGKSASAFKNFIRNSFSLLKYKKSIKNLIIDLRDNPGGYNNLMHFLAAYTLNEPYYEFKHSFSKVNRFPEKELNVNAKTIGENSMDSILRNDFDSLANGFYFNRNPSPKILPQKNSFSQSLFLLINHKTESAASHFAALHHDRKRGIIIGEESGGNYKKTNAYYQVRLNVAKGYFSVVLPLIQMEYDIRNKRYLEGRGVIPDYTISTQIDSNHTAKDSQLNFIISELLSDNHK